MNDNQNNGIVPVKEKLGYGLGEFSSSIVWQTLMFFLPAFYTDTFGLTAAAAGTMFLIVRLFDAFDDPIMGIIADRTNTRWGKFRPYVLWFAVPYGVVAALMFTTPGLSDGGKLVYAYVTYSLMMLIYTAIMIPYNSIVGVISPLSDERTSVSSYKFVMAYLAGMSVQALIIPMVKKFGHGNDALGYQHAMMLLGGISIVLFLVAFAVVKERVKPDPAMGTSLKNDLKDLLKNKYWIFIFLTSLFVLIYVAIRSGAIMYYFEYYLGKKSLASAFMVSGTLAVLIGVLPTKWLAARMGKARLFIICLVIIALSQVLFFFAGPGDIVLIFTAQIIFSLASGPTMPLVWAMLADTTDYSEWKTGRRATGLVYSATGIAFKGGFSIGGAVAMWILAAFGYVANVGQTAHSLLGIRLLMSWVPAGIAVLAIIPMFFYRLDGEMIKKIEKELKERKTVHSDQ